MIGLVLTVISLTWTTYNTIQKIPTLTNSKTTNAANPMNNGESSDLRDTDKSIDPYDAPGMKALFIQISTVFILISGYYAMILTNWGTLQSGSGIENPRQGQTALFLQATAQWIAIVLFLWSMIAPKLFPDRDFS